MNTPPGKLQAGERIDGFVLKERLHQGGMATLWSVERVDEQGRAVHPPGEPHLIMKVPRIKGGEDPATIVGFEVEQMIMPVLRGAHVPHFIAKGDFTACPYIVMELVKGQTLADLLKGDSLTIGRALGIIQQVAAALGEASEACDALPLVNVRAHDRCSADQLRDRHRLQSPHAVLWRSTSP